MKSGLLLNRLEPAVLHALLAAVLFGASTPLAKRLGDTTSPVLMAGLLYLGSGVGLMVLRWIRDRGWKPSGLQAGEWPCLLGAILLGGILGPVALMAGLRHSSGTTASLLLNLEAVLTALIAWGVFKESAPVRVVLGMAAIVAGSTLLAWSGSADPVKGAWFGPLLIALACLCWAIDNNLTRKVSASDAWFLAGFKGLVAGVVNTSMALVLSASLPSHATIASVMLLGLLGYGISLVLFVLGLRGLGTARAGAYFSTAPFVGAALSLWVLGETVSTPFLIAGALMAVGVWLHLSERHEHLHTHAPLEHSHRHVHDAHHQHSHLPSDPPGEPHTHWHRHEPLTHSHPHFPDIHHRHTHRV